MIAPNSSVIRVEVVVAAPVVASPAAKAGSIRRRDTSAIAKIQTKRWCLFIGDYGVVDEGGGVVVVVVFVVAALFVGGVWF